MARKLTVKEAKLVKGIASGKTKQQAAMEAYNASTPEAASVIASNTLKKVNVQEALQAELYKQGITLEQAVAPISKALKAKKIVQIEGDFFETEVDDLEMQIKGSDRALKLMGVSSSSDGNTTNNFIQINQTQRDKYAD